MSISRRNRNLSARHVSREVGKNGTLGCLSTSTVAVSSSRGIRTSSLLSLNNLIVSMLRFVSESTPNVREYQGHHLRIMYELRSSCVLAMGGVRLLSVSVITLCWLIKSCTPLGFLSYSLVSSIRDLVEVRHSNSSSVRLCHGPPEFIFFAVRCVVLLSRQSRSK